MEKSNKLTTPTSFTNSNTSYLLNDEISGWDDVNERTFIYKKSPVDIDTWMAQMVKVYHFFGGALAISFCFATVFRDLFVEQLGFFPHLYLHGDKASGKSKYGDSIHKFFTYKQAPFDLSSGTHVGFYRRISRMKNSTVFFEEMNEKLDKKFFQAIKGTYNNQGKELGRISESQRRLILRANSSMVISGQYLIHRDDNAIIDRAIWHPLTKRNFTSEEITEYNRLKNWENQGINSLVFDVTKHRKTVANNLCYVFDKNRKKFVNDINRVDLHFEERMLDNYNAIYTTVELLYKMYRFPFTIGEFYSYCFNRIIENSDLLIEPQG